jgi:hypothetical protein
VQCVDGVVQFARALRVLGPGNTPRVIPVGPEVVAAIDGYLGTCGVRAGSHSPTVPAELASRVWRAVRVTGQRIGTDVSQARAEFSDRHHPGAGRG